MNVELVRRIADAIEKHPKLYDQGEFGNDDLDLQHDCGTPCCVYGWAKYLTGAGRWTCLYATLVLL